MRRRRQVVTGFDPPKPGERLELERVKLEAEGKICAIRPHRCHGYVNGCECRDCQRKDLFSRAPVAA